MILTPRQRLLQSKAKELSTKAKELVRLRKQVQALAKVEAYGTKSAVGVLRKVHGALVSKLARNGLSTEYKLGEVLPRLSDLRRAIVDLLLVSHAYGYQQVKELAGIRTGAKGIVFDLKDEILPSFADANAEYLNSLRQRYDSDAFEILKGVGERADKVIRNALVEGINDGLHIEGLKERVATAMSSLGISPANSYSIENIVRTQGAIAFQAGKWQSENKDPDIAAILWGYRYATIGDDRVRPEHEELDGITLPKEDSFWDSYYPPNGYSCRCQAIALFDEYEPYIPDELPLPDEGFQFNPGKAFSGVGKVDEEYRLPPAVPKPKRTTKEQVTDTVKPAPELAPTPAPAPAPAQVTTTSLDPPKRERRTPILGESLIDAISKDEKLNKLVEDVKKLEAKEQKKLEKITKEVEAIKAEREATADKWVKGTDALREKYGPSIERTDEQRRAYNEEFVKLRNELDAKDIELRARSAKASKELDKLKDFRRDEFLKKAAIPKDQRIKFEAKYDEDAKQWKDKTESATKFLSQLVPKQDRYRWTEDDTRANSPSIETLQFDVKVTPTGRAFARPWENGIYMSKYDNVGVFVHEIGHIIEHKFGEHVIIQDTASPLRSPMYELAKSFREQRIARAGTEDVYLKQQFPTYNYKDDEKGNKDSWEELVKITNNPSTPYYIGKTYDGRYTEVITEGVEILYADPVAFAKADPEYFKFIVGTLRGDFYTKE